MTSNPPSALHQPKGGHSLVPIQRTGGTHNAACCHFNLTSLSEIAGIDARPISAYQKFAFLPCRSFSDGLTEIFNHKNSLLSDFSIQRRIIKTKISQML